MGRKILRPVEASGMQKAQLAMLAPREERGRQDSSRRVRAKVKRSHPSPDAQCGF
jgi:hypothetical protein